MNQNQTNTSEKKKKGGIIAFLRSRKAKKGFIAVLITVLFIAAIVLINVVTNILVDRVPALSIDMTKNSVFELQQESVDYVKDLDKDVTITVLQDENSFEENGTYYVQANQFLKGLEQASGHITLKYVDITKNPAFVSNYSNIDWSQSHLILVESGNQYRALDAEDLFDYDQQTLYYYGTYEIESQHTEQAVITAILNVTTEEKVKVTVLSGQGEEDCSIFTDLLESNAYEIEEVSLLTGVISEDSQFVIIFDPATDIDDDVYQTLSDWLYNDGKYGHTLVYLPNDQKAQSEFTNLNNLMEEWGMEVEDGYVFDSDISHMTNSQYPNFISIFDYDDEDYSKDVKDSSIPVVLFYTMPVRITDSSLAASLLCSSENAVVMPRDADENWNYNEETPEKLIGAAIAEKSAENAGASHVLLIGSYDAWSQSALTSHSFNNAQYFISLFNKIADRDEVGITIEGKSLDNTELSITSSGLSLFLSILFRYVIPAAILIVGLVVWIRRRNK